MLTDILEQELEQELELSRGCMVLLYVLKQFDELREMGIIEGGFYEVSKEGKERLGNFEPTNEEVEEMIIMMKENNML